MENDGLHEEQYLGSGFSGNACSGKSGTTGSSSVVAVIVTGIISESAGPLDGRFLLYTARLLYIKENACFSEIPCLGV